MQFLAEFRKTAPECNPEYTIDVIEAEKLSSARAWALLLTADPNWHPGWTSKGEPEHWGKAAGIALVALKEATDELLALRQARRLATLLG